MLAGVSHGQDVGKNLSRWQWRRDADPTADSSCATQDGGAITATTVTHECLHETEQIISTYCYTQNSFSLPVSTLPPFKYEPITRPSTHPVPFFHPSILLQSAYFNWFHLLLFSLHCVLFPRILCLAIIYTYPAAPVHPSCLTSRLYIYHLQIETSITALSIRPFILFSHACEFCPSQHQTCIISVDTDVQKLLKTTCARAYYRHMLHQALFSYTLRKKRTVDVNL